MLRMNTVHVKICGLTIPDQARAIADMGADAIGLNFAPSKRRITPEQGSAIVQAVGERARTVGLFVDAPADEINAVVEATGVGCVQLHGNESPEIVAEISAPCWKVFHIDPAGDENFITEIHEWLVCLPTGAEVEAILLDTYSPKAAGGTGESFNWETLAHLRDEGFLGDLPPIILAGGLKPDNVAEAIRITQPSMVDVSSGVESSPGVKDLVKVREFLRAAKSV